MKTLGEAMPLTKPDSIVRQAVNLRQANHPQRLRWMRPQQRGAKRPSHFFESAKAPTGPLAATDVFLQRVVETCASRVAVLDETGKILFVSKSRCSPAPGDRLFGGRFRWLLTWFKREDGPDTLSRDREFLLSGDIGEILNGTLSVFQREYYCQDHGETRWFGVHAARLDLPESDRFRVILSIEEITTKREAEAKLRDLSGRLISAQEEERRRIALELHDDLNQRLALLSVELDQIAQRIPEVQRDVRMSIQNVRARAHELSSAIQKVAYQLHPSMLDQLGLPDAVRRLCEEMARHHEIRITFRDRGSPHHLSKEVTLCLYRIVQESLRNVIKHSGSQEAAVILSATDGIVRLFISDVGKGFDLHSAKAKGGLGLIGMTERLRSVGGEISILSNERGTKIRVSIATSGEEQNRKLALRV